MWAFLIGGFLMRLTIGLILTCAWQLGAVTCQNSQKGVGKDRLHKQLKSSFWGKNKFERILSRPKFACKFADWSTAAYSDSSCVKTNLEIMIFEAKKKLNTCSYSGRHFGESEETWVTSGNEEVTGSYPVEALIFFFFRLLLSYCLNWKIYYDDHSSLLRL